MGEFHKYIRLIPLLIFVLNLATRIFYINGQDICHDEPFTIYHAQFKTAEIWNLLKNYNNPPLFEILLHYWIKLWGLNDFSLRLLPLLFSSLASVVLYYLGARYFNVKVGLLASLMLTFSSLSIYYAFDCRAYSALLLFSIVSSYFYLAVISNLPKRIDVVLHILFSSVLVYLHYFGVLVLFIQLLHALIFSRKAIKTFFISGIAIFVVYLPHIMTMLSRFTHSASGGTWIQAPAGAESLYNMLWSFCNAPFATVLCIVILVLLPVLFWKQLHGIFSKSLVGYLITGFLFSYFGLFFISYKIPVFIDRYLIFVLPFFYLLISVIVLGITNKNSIQAIIIFVLVTLFAVTANYRPQKKRNPALALSVIKVLKNAETDILVAPFDYILAFSYQYDKAIFSDIKPNDEYNHLENSLKNQSIYFLNNSNDLQSLADKINRRHIVYLDAEADFYHPGNNILPELKSRFKLVKEKRFNDNLILYYFIQGSN